MTTLKWIPLLAVTTTGLGLSAAAVADGHRFGAPDPTWQDECGSCHVAYPPQLLPAASWRALFAGLDDHFGTDAAVAQDIAAALLDHAVSNAGRPVESEPPLRISEMRWFLREHDEVSPATWNKPEVGSQANCAACHTRAEQGDFSERYLEIPR